MLDKFSPSRIWPVQETHSRKDTVKGACTRKFCEIQGTKLDEHGKTVLRRSNLIFKIKISRGEQSNLGMHLASIFWTPSFVWYWNHVNKNEEIIVKRFFKGTTHQTYFRRISEFFNLDFAAKFAWPTNEKSLGVLCINQRQIRFCFEKLLNTRQIVLQV